MRSLFAKILLWFLATVGVTFVGVVAISTLNFASRQLPISRLLSFQLAEARHAYEAGGREGLGIFLQRVREGAEADGVLTDSNGRDVLTGQDWSEVVQKARRPFSIFGRALPFFRRNRAVLPRGAPDGKYWWLLLIPQQNIAFWLIAPQSLWILLAVILLCYALALNLTSPLRKLQKTLERFGQGDFAARVGSKRRDELGQLTRTFDQMAQRIQTLLDAERRLLLDISHELRSPLARLGVAIELARGHDSPELQLNRIEREAERLNALVSELLQVTRAEGDPTSLKREPIALHELIERIVDDCRIEAEAQGCEINYQAASRPTVLGDPELLRRAAENILRNAIRYSPSGSEVGVSLNLQEPWACVVISDCGPGVPEVALGRIFEPFYRVETDRDRNSGGVGLGLSIARRAVELHGGHLRAVNQNPGLLVQMDLPAA